MQVDHFHSYLSALKEAYIRTCGTRRDTHARLWVWVGVPG